MSDKRMSMREAISTYVRSGQILALEGFTAAIPFSAAHEIIRQGHTDLVLARMTPDLIYDQMVAAGVARKLVFSYLGNPGVGPLHAIRRAVEKGVPRPLELEEYSHYGMVGRYLAGAYRLPFFPLHSYTGTDMPRVNPLIRSIESPYGEGAVAVVPPLNPDVAIIQAQRADPAGNTQMWGLLGAQKEVAFAAGRLIVVVEEIVGEEVIRADPNRTAIPALIVDAVVHEPFGSHPSYVQGYYDRDNDFYLEWDQISREEARTADWLRAWVYEVPDRPAYLQKLGAERIEGLRPGTSFSTAVDYGDYSR